MNGNNNGSKSPARNGNAKPKRRRGGRRGNGGGANPRGGSRAAGLARNPGFRKGRDALFSLTRDQFTATSPTNYFTVSAGSTPGGVRVRGRELIQAVVMPIINAGIWTPSTSFPGGVVTPSASNITPASFPRLSAYGPIYEYFQFKTLAFMFQSNQPTTTAGEIIISVDYDPGDPAPTSTSLQMRNVSSTMANIYSDCSLEMLASLSRLPKYETTPTTAITAALQQIQGVLCVATEGYTAAAISTVGYIVAQYDIEFFTPQ